MIREIEFRSRRWECSDGERFDNEEDALSHEYDLIHNEFLRRGGNLISSIGRYKILVINNKEELDLFKKCCDNEERCFYSVENKELEKIFPFILIELADDDDYYHYFCQIGEYIVRLKKTTKSLEDIVLKINQKSE